MPPLQIKTDQRFELVKIAFGKTLDVQIQFADPDEMGRGIDEALQKLGAAENGMSPYERDCHKHNLDLCTGEPSAK